MSSDPSTPADQNDGAPPYRAPGWFTRHVFNRAIAASTRLGLSIWGSRVLEIPGRRSGVPRRVPVNLLAFGGASYLVAPRGETQWVRNLRANGDRLVLIRGNHREAWEAEPIDDAAKGPVLRAYLKRWKAEVGIFFDGVGPDSPDEDVTRIAPRHPVFRITRAPAG
jgi:deazaflavin-dependent oxidoreductase (nitroreductase family)